MKQDLLVSVIVPIYNQDKYLNKSIPSVLNQTYSNLDIVLVNDGSTDSSIDIIREYANQDSRIQIVEKENGGLVDATLAGIEASKGELLCFLDPDDFLGHNYIKILTEGFTENCDFVAAGFYYENKGVLTPYVLKEDRFYTKEELLSARDTFLFEGNDPVISNRFFISRWNKMYRSSLIKRVAERFSECRSISLGEDTLFTYLMLNFASGGKTISKPNSYFYNVGNQNSMMKSGQYKTQLVKSRTAFEKLLELTKRFNSSASQAYALYFFLLEGVITKVQTMEKDEAKNLYYQLKCDNEYSLAKRLMINKSRSLKAIVKGVFGTTKILPYVKKIIFLLCNAKKYLSFWLKKCLKRGPIRATRLVKFQIDRDNAFKDINKKLPILEKRIYPILKQFLGENTIFKNSPIEKNVFVFWWEGFDNAPEIVKSCLNSVKKHHDECNVITIDKFNYAKYTDIDSRIIKDFEKDKISVQTFSDILRFNLLKNNGGMWIDSTIFFSSKFNLLEELKEKSFTSLEFSTSRDFLKYEDVECSWSGFFIASRKSGLFVRAVDEIFKQYYLKHQTYSTYFFIDAVLMICKKYGLDDCVLNKTLKTAGSMFALASLLEQQYDGDVVEIIKSVPQKLRWNCDKVNRQNTFYGWVLSRE